MAYGNDPVGTPGMAYAYDRRGRQTTVSRGGATSTLTYNDADQVISESHAGGILAGLSVASPVDSLLRRSQVAAKLGSTVLGSTVSYGYDGLRLASVSDGVHTARYGYLANSPLVGQITFQHNATVRLITSRDFDNLNRLKSISSAATTAVGPFVASSHESRFNSANQRTRITLRDGAYWIYTYDALGQVLSGMKYWADDTPVAGQQFEYVHDDIGNRTSTKMGGDAAGGNLRSASYTVNSRNQYDSRTVPNTVDVLGVGNTAASITVNGQAAYRKGEYFQVTLGSLANGSAPVYLPITVTENLNGNIVEKEGSLFVPPATEVYTSHDADGNLTQDGRWTYTWDAENRLVQMVAKLNVPLAAIRKLEFEYDWTGRRIRKTVWTTSDGVNYVNPITTKYLYDGWNLVAELDENNALLRSYIWGLDLSGALQGAGGVGGLLAVKPASDPAQFVCYDWNGNVSALVDASTGAVTAQYEYGPFGEVIRATSSISPAIPIRWSTKYTDLETDLVYYGYRYYNPSTGRWLNRDPLEEEGGMNLYCFVRNHPTIAIDSDGRAEVPTIPPDPKPPGDGRQEREQFARDIQAQFNAWKNANKDKCCNLDPCSLAAQWMLESNWGRSQLSKEGKNLGGVKGTGSDGSIELPTTEIENGRRVRTTAKFQKHKSFTDYYEYYAKLICQAQRYKDAIGKKGKEYYDALQKGGYSTNPNYADEVMPLYRQLGCK